MRSLLIIFLLPLVTLFQNKTNAKFRAKFDLSETPGKSYALIIAVSDYQNQGLDKIPNGEDVKAIGQKLTDDFGFEVEHLDNPSKEDIKNKLGFYERDFKKGLKDSTGQLLIFFSGHGANEFQNGFFLAKDSDPSDVENTSLSYNYWRPRIADFKCKHIFVLIDACFSGTFDPNWYTKVRGRQDELSETDKLVLNYQQIKSRIFMTSAGDNPSPMNSSFTKGLSMGLASLDGDGILSSLELIAQIKNKCPNAHHGEFEKSTSPLFLMFNRHKYGVDSDKDGIPDNKDKCPNEFSFISSNGCSSMQLIPGGTFKMGSEDRDDEKPVTEKQVKSFYLSRYEVTIADFKRFIEETKYKTDADILGGAPAWDGEGWNFVKGVNWRYRPDGSLRPVTEYDHPVSFVSWNDAVSYCKWLSKQSNQTFRLPTEAEWEYAAGNGKKHSRFSWGDNLPVGKNSGNIADETFGQSFRERPKWDNFNDGFLYTGPVGSFNPNEFGLFDMIGNVWEICANLYTTDYNQALSSNNDGPVAIRGASWRNEPEYIGVSRRFSLPNKRSTAYSVGFRVAMDK